MTQTQQIDLGPILTISAVVVVMGAGIAMMTETRNPDGMTGDIVARSGLIPYELHPMVPGIEKEEAAKKRLPVSVRSKPVGVYEVIAKRWKESCSVKLYENLPGWKKKLRAYRSVDRVGECDALFERTVEAVKQVRFEYKTALGR